MDPQQETARGYVVWLADEAPPREELFLHGVRVDTIDRELPAGELARLAPDVVVVGGRSADRARELGAVHPVVVIEIGPPDAPFEGCHGVVARLDPTLEDDAIATRIAALLRRLASRAHASLTIARGDLAELTARIADEGRAGVLLCGSPPGAITFAGEGASESEVAELCRRTADRAELSLRFFELAPARMKVLGISPVKAAMTARLEGLGALVIDGGDDGTQQIVDTLSEAGARAQLVLAKPEAIERARSSDPSLIVVASTTLATPAGRLLLEDARLGSAALLVIDPSRRPMDETALRALAAEACADEIAARERVLAGTPTIERLETLGAARWLKTIAGVTAPMRMRVRSGAGHGEIVFGGGKITDASFFPSTPEARRLRGAAAVPALVAVTHGTLLVGPADAVHERPEPERVSSATANANANANAPATATPTAMPPAPTAADAAAQANAPTAELLLVPQQPSAPLGSPERPRARSGRAVLWGLVSAAVLAGAYLAADRLVSTSASSDTAPAAAPAELPTAVATPVASSPSAEVPVRVEPLPTTRADDPTDEPAQPTDAPTSAEPEESAELPPATDRARVAALVVQSDEAMRDRDYERGLALAQEALALEPRHARAAYDSALAMLRLRRDDEALTWAERAMGWDPTEPLYPLLVGDIHLQHGRRARARAAWRRCLLIDPPHESCVRRIELADARDAAE